MLHPNVDKSISASFKWVVVLALLILVVGMGISVYKKIPKDLPPPKKPASVIREAAPRTDTFRLIAPAGYTRDGKVIYSEEYKINLGSYYIAPLVGQEGCVRYMINDVPQTPTCPGERLSVNYESGKNEVVRVRIHSEESRPITFEFIPVHRSQV